MADTVSSRMLASALRSLLERQAPESLVAAYFFGSHAESRAHRESDVDVGVLFARDQAPTSRDRFEERLRLSSLLAPVASPGLVDLVVLNDAPPGLAARIVTTGRLLYCRDPEAEHAFRRDAQLRAADVEPFLRRMRAIKLGAIVR
jgi:predicted nucleotidyltransferase